MTPFNIYKLYCALSTHFTNPKYDFFKYDGRTTVKFENFEKRRDKYFFHKLSRCVSQCDMQMYLCSNFVDHGKVWVGDLIDQNAKDTFLKHRKIHESLKYTFKNECELIFGDCENPNEIIISVNGCYPLLLIDFFQNKLSIETLCILDDLLDFIPDWDKSITDTIRWPTYSLKIKKYKPFIKYDKEIFKQILLEVANLKPKT